MRRNIKVRLDEVGPTGVAYKRKIRGGLMLFKLTAQLTLLRLIIKYNLQ